MDLAWVSWFDGDEQVVGPVRGDAAKLSLRQGARIAEPSSLCHLVQGSHTGAPITAADGSVLGMVCCVSDTSTVDADRRIVSLIADLIAELVNRQDQEAQQRHDASERIRAEIHRGRMTTAFQPIVDMSTGETVGAEALTRFPGSASGPEAWFADAANAGLGAELELAAIQLALGRLDDLPTGVYLSLNASPSTLGDPRLQDLVAGSDPTRLVIEVTEHAEIDDYALLATSLAPLRQLGVRVAVDDLGAGFSSFSHVLELSPHLLKLDASITRGCDSDPARQALAAAVVGVAARLGASVIAEGVETQAELDTVTRLGIPLVQGFFTAAPSDLPMPTVTARPSRISERRRWQRPRRNDTTIAGQRFELVLLHSPIGMCLVAPSGAFLHTNPALAALLRFSQRELSQLTFQEVTHPDDLDLDMGLLRQCLAGRRSNYRISKRYVRSDGTTFLGDLSVVLVRSDDGTPLHFISQIQPLAAGREVAAASPPREMITPGAR